MTTFSVTLEEFKHMVSSFCKAAPVAPANELEAGMKAVALGYIGLKPDTSEVELIIAQSYLMYAARVHLKRELELGVTIDDALSLERLLRDGVAPTT